MKKLIFSILLFFVGMVMVNAQEHIAVSFKACVDGDTAKFTFNDATMTARFLAIDTPEIKSTNKTEEFWGKEASKYTCDRLTKASRIEIEYDNNSNRVDKYDRQLVWIWIDGSLLQQELIKEGLAKVAYLYGDYQHTKLLQEEQEKAINNKVGMWIEDEKVIEEIKPIDDEKVIDEKEKMDTDDYIAVGVIIMLAIISIITGNITRKKYNIYKKELKKRINK